MRPGPILERLALASLLLLVGCATGLLPPHAELESGGEPRTLLNTLLDCDSPADFLAAQQGVDMPRVESYVGVWRPQSGLRFADLLVIEVAPSSGGARRVETFSLKTSEQAVSPSAGSTSSMRAVLSCPWIRAI